MRNILYFALGILTILSSHGQNTEEMEKNVFIKIDNESDYCKIVIIEKQKNLLLIDVEMLEGAVFDTDSGIVMSLVNDGKIILESTLSAADINGKLVTSFYVSKELIEKMKLSANFFRNGSKFRLEINIIEDDHHVPKPVTSIIKYKIIE